MKKFLAILLSAVLMLSLAVPAMAVGTNTITVNNTVANETYKIYKLFDLSVNEAMTAYTYTVNAEWTEFFTTGKGKDYVTIDAQGYVSIADNDAAANLAEAAAAALTGKTVVDTILATGNSITFTGLDNGYYLITSTLGTLAMTDTTPTNPNAKVNEKNPQDTIKKEVKEDSTGKFGAQNDAQVGDTVEFKSEATLHPHTRNVKIHDTMDAGLTYNNDVKIYTSYDEATKTFSGELDASYYTVLSTPEEGDTFTISFNQDYLDNLSGKTVLYLKYSAVLNENAIATVNGVAIVDQENQTTITYGDKQSVEDGTITTTHKFSVFKFYTTKNVNDKNEEIIVKNYLADAVFSLKKNGTVIKLIKLDDNNYRVAKGDETGAVETFTTVADGDIVIWGVDSDNDYTLEEITPPAGYNKLTAEVAVTVNAENGTRVEVENNSGTELPSTGGIGTTIFYAVGGVMVAAAAILLITKKRMSTEG